MNGIDLSTVPVQLIINIINIVVLFVLLRLLAYKPVKKYMDARSARVQAEMDGAKQANEQAQAMRDEVSAALAGSEQKAAAILHDGEEAAMKNAEIILQQAREQAARLLDEARAQADEERRQAMGDMKNQVAELAVLIAQKILEREIDAQDQQKLIDDFFKKVG